MISKDQEAEMLRAFVATLPQNSYISDFFQGCVPFFVDAMRSDMPCTHADNLRALEDEHRSIQQQIKDATAKLDKVNDEIDNREQFKASIERDIA